MNDTSCREVKAKLATKNSHTNELISVHSPQGKIIQASNESSPIKSNEEKE